MLAVAVVAGALIGLSLGALGGGGSDGRGLTAASGIVAAIRMHETRAARRPGCESQVARPGVLPGSSVFGHAGNDRHADGEHDGECDEDLGLELAG